MSIDIKTLAAAQKYTKKSLQGAGALKGQKGDPGKDGKDAPIITNVNIDEDNILSTTLSDGTTLTGGTIKTVHGKDGKDGVSVPKGGEPGQVLVKKSENDYDTEWKDAPISDDSNKYTIIQGTL